MSWAETIDKIKHIVMLITRRLWRWIYHLHRKEVSQGTGQAHFWIIGISMLVAYDGVASDDGQHEIIHLRDYCIPKAHLDIALYGVCITNGIHLNSQKITNIC